MQARQSKRTRSLSNPGGVVGIVAYTPPQVKKGDFYMEEKKRMIGHVTELLDRLSTEELRGLYLMLCRMLRI